MSSQALQERREAQIKEWNARITELEARMEKAIAQAKISSEEERNELRAKRDALREKLDEYRRAGDRAADDVMKGLQQAWNSMSDALDRAKAHF